MSHNLRLCNDPLRPRLSERPFGCGGSDAAGGAGWRDLTGKLVFPGPVVLCCSDAPRAWQGGLPATTVAVPVASLGPPVDAVPLPRLRGVAAPSDRAACGTRIRTTRCSDTSSSFLPSK